MNFLDQQLISISFRLPLIDWGERKGNIKTAKMNKEVMDIEIAQEENDLYQKIKLKISDFNLQEEIVMGAMKSKEIARMSYEITEKRFISGTVDLLRLTTARKAWQIAEETYISSLYNYWKSYYEIQQFTLFNYRKNTNLKKELEGLLNFE